MANNLYRKTVTIASGQSLSNAVSLGPFTLIGVEMPAAWDAAGLTFQQASTIGGTYRDIKVGGASASDELTVAAAANDFLALDPANLVSVEALKVRSGTAAAPVAQSADRSIGLILRPI